MGFHCYHDRPCPRCSRFFIRFDPSEMCPFCGSAEAPVYPLVDEILHYARLTLASQGDLELRAFTPSGEADRYVMLAYDLLEAFRHVTDLEPAMVAAEAVGHYRLGGDQEDDAQRAHWQRFFTALLAGWQSERHRPLDPLPPSDRLAVGGGPTEAVVARPASSQSFRKKWSPKE